MSVKNSQNNQKEGQKEGQALKHFDLSKSELYEILGTSRSTFHRKRKKGLIKYLSEQLGISKEEYKKIKRFEDKVFSKVCEYFQITDELIFQKLPNK